MELKSKNKRYGVFTTHDKALNVFDRIYEKEKEKDNIIRYNRGRNCLLIELSNGDVYKWMTCNESSRGCRFTDVIIDKTIVTIDFLLYVILPCVYSNIDDTTYDYMHYIEDYLD